MKQRASNPFRVILSGIIDLVFLAAGLFLIFIIFRNVVWRVEIGGLFYPVPGFFSTGFLLGYIFFVLPFTDYKGGSAGKRIMRLKCTGIRGSQMVTFGNYLLKSLLYGLPILFGFALSFRLLQMTDSQTEAAINIVDIILPSVFIIQGLTLFTGRRSLFEWVSCSVVVPKKMETGEELFSFEGTELQSEIRHL